MSLLDDAFENFIVINKAIVDDGYGGTTTKWTVGATISGVMVYNTSDEQSIAQALGSTSDYTFTCRKDLYFDYHMVLKRERDGKLFRLTSNSDDLATPKGAGLNMRQYTAEELTALPV